MKIWYLLVATKPIPSLEKISKENIASYHENHFLIILINESSS